MPNDPAVSLILTAIFGAFCQEVLHWYELRNCLEDERYKKILRSLSYWIITLLMIAISGFGAWIVYGEQITVRSAYFILGASFPLLFKKVVSSVGDTGNTNLGNNIVRDYFFFNKTINK